jgi:hypothetical protein
VLPFLDPTGVLCQVVRRVVQSLCGPKG